MTAHPTEAKRRSILKQILRLSDQFDQPEEVFEAHWRSDETRAQRVTPFDEAGNKLFFFERTIIPAIARFCAGFDGEPRQAYPTVRRVPALTVNGIAFPMQSTD